MKRRLLVLLLLLSCVAHADPQRIELKIKEHAISAEVAATPAARERGLMFRKALPENRGMIFVFPQTERYSMWMENTALPLAVAFLDKNGTILNIEEMQPLTPDFHSAAGAAGYALEMNAGWFARRGIRAGDQVLGLERAPRGQ